MTTLTVKSPAELISTVPFLVGFHPCDSLVVIALQGRRVIFAMRIDLPEHDTPEEEARISVLHLASVVLRHEPTAVTIIGYGDEPRVTPAVQLLAEAFGKAQLPVTDELRVTDDRFWSCRCTDPTCCPPEGRTCLPSDSVIAAEATFAGAVALPNREALEAQLSPVTGDERKAMAAATVSAVGRMVALEKQARRETASPAGQAQGADLRMGGKPRKGADPLAESDHVRTLTRRAGRLAIREAERCYSTGGRLSDEDAAWLGLLLCDKVIRDYAWSRTRTREWELALWSDLMRRVPAHHLPAPAGLLAFVAFRRGQGALASIAVERIREREPNYAMAVLIGQALMIGLPPSALDGWPATDDCALIEACFDPDDLSLSETPDAEEAPSPEDTSAEELRSESVGDLPIRRRSAASSGPVHPPRADRPPVRARSDTPRAGARARAAKTANLPVKREKSPSAHRRS